VFQPAPLPPTPTALPSTQATQSEVVDNQGVVQALHPAEPELQPDVARMLSTALADRSHLEEAARLMTRALHAEGSRDSAEWSLVAALLMESGLAREALTLVNELLLLDPTASDVLALKATALLSLERGTYAEALELAERAVLHAPNDPVVVAAAALANAANGAVARANERLDQIGDVQLERNRIAHVEYAVATAADDFERAWTVAEVIAEHSPFNARDQVRAANSGLVNRAVPGDPIAQHLGDEVRRFRRVIDPTIPHLAERVRRLEAALALEPQFEPALRAVQELRPANPGRVLINASISAVVGLAVAGAGLRALPLIPALLFGALVLGSLGARFAIVDKGRRQITPTITAWRRYADTRERQQAVLRQGSDRRVVIPAPRGSVIESAAGCHCETVNFLHSALALEYARQHLVWRQSLSPGIDIFACPSTLAAWVGLSSFNGGDFRLCHLSDVPLIPHNEPPQPLG
jgi:tetratricopeptide (TPR) repeat protein